MINKDADNNKRDRLKMSNNSKINTTSIQKLQLTNYQKNNYPDSKSMNEDKMAKKIHLIKPVMKLKPKYQKKYMANNKEKNKITDLKEKNSNIGFKETMIYNNKYIHNINDLEKMSQTYKSN